MKKPPKTGWCSIILKRESDVCIRNGTGNSVTFTFKEWKQFIQKVKEGQFDIQFETKDKI